MKVRFLADADLNKAIVNGVLRRDPAIDFLTAHTAGLRCMKDPEVLALAARAATGARFSRCWHNAGGTFGHSRMLASAALAYSSYRKLSISELRSRNSCSSGSLRMHPNGKIGWSGCHCKAALWVRPEAATEVSSWSPHQEIYFGLALCFRIKQCGLRKFGEFRQFAYTHASSYKLMSIDPSARGRFQSRGQDANSVDVRLQFLPELLSRM